MAKNIRLEDFDASVASMLKQGGIFAATQLRDKYPQLAYWISIAATAIDFIVRAFQKSPLRIMPTIIQASDSQGQNNNTPSNYSSGSSNSTNAAAQNNPVKISLFAESQPGDDGFVSAYPIVVHKWQADPDPEVISLRPPVLAEPCLHVGINLLKNSDITADLSADTFTRDFKLVMSASNGFRKDFPLRKNLGLGGWELNLTNEDLNSIPKINMNLEAEMTGVRGFNELKSPKFDLPLATANKWEIKPESQKAFAVGGKRRVTIQNTLGSCRCLQAVIYKPSFGGQFVFSANGKENGLEFSADGREASFEVDAANFQPGQGTLELKTYGDGQQQGQQQQSNTLNIKLYPLPPRVTDVKISKGDRYAVVTGERLEQLQYVVINGKRATVVGNAVIQGTGGNNPGAIGGAANIPPGSGSNPNKPANQNANPNLNLNSNQRAAVFDDSSAGQTAGAVSIELGLDDNRIVPVQQTFAAGAARPTIAADEANEIDGVFIKNSNAESADAKSVNVKESGLLKSSAASSPALGSGLSALDSLIIPIDASEMSIAVRNKLTDYDFKGENLSVETRIENSQPGSVQPPQVAFEVLDSDTLRLKFTFSRESQKFIGGRRLQFRIKDRERGDSDWYTIKQTFVRIPQITSVRCTNEMNNQCEMKGNGIDYIGQVSVDGGKNWHPQTSQPQMMLEVRATDDGKTQALIPLLTSKKLLMIRLRDFPKMDGIFVNDYVFTNLVRGNQSKGNQSAPSGAAPASNPHQANGNAAPKQSPNQMSNGFPVQSAQQTPGSSKPKAKNSKSKIGSKN